MKAILEFNLPEESSEFRQATQAGNYYCCLVELDRRLHQILKYEQHTPGDAYRMGLERARTILSEIMDEYDVNIHD
jgi:hypothetical protein